MKEEPKQKKPGIKSTEFWLTAVACLCGLLYSSGLIAPDSGGDKALGLFATVLGAMGYSVSRSMVKMKE